MRTADLDTMDALDMDVESYAATLVEAHIAGLPTGAILKSHVWELLLDCGHSTSDARIWAEGTLDVESSHDPRRASYWSREMAREVKRRTARM